MPKRKDMNKVLKKAFGHGTFLVFKMTLAEALSLGLLICECGHMPNNHFQWDDKPCAHCKCKKYREKARVGTLVKQGKKNGKEKETSRVRQAARKRSRPRSSSTRS